MSGRPRLVFDTNILVSHLLLPGSVPAQAVRKGLGEEQLLVSEATLMELAVVLSKPKFDSYVSVADRQEFFKAFGRVVEKAPIVKVVRACKDPEDDKFLELAVNGAASSIITGDRTLLALDPFQGIRIITPVEYLGGKK